MSAEVKLAPPLEQQKRIRSKPLRPARRKSSLLAHGEPMMWLTGGSLIVCMLMIAGLLALVAYQGLFTFWPKSLVRFETANNRVYMGEVTSSERFEPAEGDWLRMPEDAREEAGQPSERTERPSDASSGSATTI